MPPSTTPINEINGAYLKRQYLISYNAISAALWFGVLGRVAMWGYHGSLYKGGWLSEGANEGVYEASERYTRLTQTLAVMEVVHSFIGVVRAPVLTTLMQVASRLLLVWGIAYNFPQTTKNSPAYTTMLLAWSVTEVIRYSYFVFVLGAKGVPKLWTWLRYNTFLVLYPLGVGSETWLIYSAIPPASKMDEKYGYALWAVLATYIPGFYTLFTYMLKQRRRVLRVGAEKKQN
ncbi:PTPLA-domain-containing protein [Lentithecium fluviatile CBS 122367]|uniref:Very-long-chain (3R)-3-hydroxyacyl-CoA dehydratase n=1 Tax=Lentithecium fluviatile CBS 122367 TaxID=1168545 RepID=A0A6G1IUF8_9PLEO|nr:PTPLA-domain-containing protein [Lentithecium fluviatile CBS 122367]